MRDSDPPSVRLPQLKFNLRQPRGLEKGLLGVTSHPGAYTRQQAARHASASGGAVFFVTLRLRYTGSQTVCATVLMSMASTANGFPKPQPRCP